MPIPGLSLAAALSLALLLGCPGNDSAPTSEPAPASDPALVAASGWQLPARADVNYPPMVVDYVLATLRDPVTHDHASLEQAWDIISQLEDPSVFSAEVKRQVQGTGNAPPIGIVSAWLAVEPEAAADWLVTQVKQGQVPYLNALLPHPELGRQVLAQTDLRGAGRETTEIVLLLLRKWEPLEQGDAALLQELAASAEPRVKLRAIGYLLALGAADAAQVEELKEALRSDKISVLASAVEACRISRSEELAATLVGPAAQIPLTGTADSYDQPTSTSLYASYGLAYLPGEQAQLLRSKLLNAEDVRVRWQARLGELLHGDIEPWYDALLAGTDSQQDMLLAIQPEGVADQALLLTYKQLSTDKTPEVRLAAAQQMNRYAAYASDPLVKEVLQTLQGEETIQIAAQAWHSAAQIGVPGMGARAQAVLDNGEAPPAVRLAAAFYLLRQAEPDAAPAQGGAR